MKRELWFKNGIERKIICYCNNIDTEQMEKAVNDYGLTTWEQIVLKFRSSAIEKCEILNPTGYFCREHFDNVVEQIKTKIKSLHLTSGIKDCRFSRLFKGCNPLQLLCNLTGNRPQTATFHTAGRCASV